MTEFEQIVISAVRYALPRHTYITSVVADFTLASWGGFSGSARELIRRDVHAELERPTSSMMDMDRRIWQSLYDRTTELQHQPTSQADALERAENVIGELMKLAVNVGGWVAAGKSETAVKAITEARKDGWAATGYRDYLRLRGAP